MDENDDVMGGVEVGEAVGVTIGKRKTSHILSTHLGTSSTTATVPYHDNSYLSAMCVVV